MKIIQYILPLILLVFYSNIVAQKNTSLHNFKLTGIVTYETTNSPIDSVKVTFIGENIDEFMSLGKVTKCLFEVGEQCKRNM